MKEIFSSNVPTLTTPRFTLRMVDRGDASALFPTFSDMEQCRFMSQSHFDDVAKLADWMTDTTWPGRTWIAVDKSDGMIVGRYVAFPGRDEGVLELGYITVVGRQGQGVARECMTGVMDYLFRTEEHRKLYVEIDVANDASVALAERLGFSREGLLREHEATHSGVCDLLVYGMLRREWIARAV